MLALAITAAQVASRGFDVLQELLIWNLIWAPYLGAFLGLGLSRTRRPGPRTWRRPQLRTHTLMVVVAYVAFLFGMGAWAGKLSRPARQYHQKWATADSLSKTYRELGQKAEDDAALRRSNVGGLHAGKIPEGLLLGQRDFLRSLEEDSKVTPDHRKLRRDLITDGEEKSMIRQEQNADLFGRLAAYHDGLAAKYDRARWRPWLPVEPDPPVPK